MKMLRRLLPLLPLVFLPRTVGQIPVTDLANLANNTILQAETIAKWVESIQHLRTQIDQLNRQIDLQSDLRQWSGNPYEAGVRLMLEGMGEGDLVRTYGETKDAILGTLQSLDSLGHTASGTYRAIGSLDLNGTEVKRDPLLYRRFALLDAVQANSDRVAEATQAREQDLQAEIALTLADLKSAPTDAEAQKQAAKLTALNGQLTQVEASRRREVDAVTTQKIANDARAEAERVAAAELAARDDYLAQQRVSAYLGGLKLRQHHAH